MSTTPTTLTMRQLRDDGWPVVEKVEHWDAIREAGWTVLVHGWEQPGGPRTRWVLGRVVDVS